MNGWEINIHVPRPFSSLCLGKSGISNEKNGEKNYQTNNSI